MIASCSKCRSIFNGEPDRTFLGFQRMVCPKCGNRLSYPLSRGYRIFYWMMLVLMGLMIVAAFAQGDFAFPGIIGICMIVALVRDARLRRRQ